MRFDRHVKTNIIKKKNCNKVKNKLTVINFENAYAYMHICSTNMKFSCLLMFRSTYCCLAPSDEYVDFLVVFSVIFIYFLISHQLQKFKHVTCLLKNGTVDNDFLSNLM